MRIRRFRAVLAVMLGAACSDPAGLAPKARLASALGSTEAHGPRMPPRPPRPTSPPKATFRFARFGATLYFAQSTASLWS